MLPRLFLLIVGLLAGLSLPASAQAPIGGRWEGAIKIAGQELAIVVTFAGDARAPKATIDIPQQGAKGLGLTNVRVDGPRVHFELPAGPGVAVFDGEAKGDEMAGTFEQGGTKGTFDMKRGAAPLPEAPPPYKVEEVKIQHDGLTLAGTLTVPPARGPHPAVVLITGSGAQNRDEEVFGFPVFKRLADHLTRAGLAVLRCDDRGVGGSTGSVPESTSADFAEDVLAEIAFLEARADIDRGRIGLLGHSEGGLIAPMVAARSAAVGFIVLMSGPALTGEKIMLAQAELIGRAEGRTEGQIRANARVQQQLFDAARRNTGWDAALETVRAEMRGALDGLPEAQRKAIPDIDRLANRQAESQVAFVRSPWFRYFLDYDPAPALARLKCPVLALFGERDLQVPTDANRAAMEALARKSGNADWTITVVPQANHLYQAATTGSASEYPRLKKEFAPGFIDTLVPWLAKRARLRG